MLPATLAALLAGCQFEPVGALPGDGGAPPAPPDAVPDASVDAPPPDAPPPDRDLDTVPDADDNCPDDPNTDQANCDGDQAGDACDLTSEGPDMDSDTVSDACDNCPTVSNTDQISAVGDEVGVVCDPRPGQSGDIVAYFTGFDGDSTAQPPGWSLATGGGLINGQWRVENGKLVHDPSEQASILYLSGQDVPGDVVIETRFSVNAFVADLGAVASLSVISRYSNGLASGGQDTGYVCQLEQGIGGDAAAGVRIREITDTVTGFVDASWSGELNQTYAIVHTQAGTSGGAFTSRCTVVPPAPDVEATASLDRPGPASGRVAVRTQRIGAAFDYLLVYGLGSSNPAPVAVTPSASHPAP